MCDCLKDKQVDDDILQLEEEENAVVDKEFLERMNLNLKGDWESWKPEYQEFCEELDYHVSKLKIAINYANHDNIREYSADTANLCEKAFTTFKEI